jgi:hypothetical protein
MKIGKYSQRQKELIIQFRSVKKPVNDNYPVGMECFGFESTLTVCVNQGKNKFINEDRGISENRNFLYPVFLPGNREKSKSCIVLLHGLNERNWDKYLCWAEYLATHTRKPVILFPIAFHINRGLPAWSNPWQMVHLREERQKAAGNPDSLTFVNAALSERLTNEPNRFFYSGRQTIRDITQLARQIRNGNHPLFSEGTVPDFFCYSIGSFLAEVMLMADHDQHFSSSRIFIFCGGAIFNSMYGESRFIMDKVAYDRLLHYYNEEWFGILGKKPEFVPSGNDALTCAFGAMIRPDKYNSEREGFFRNIKTRIAGISLLQDKVMPYSGVEACMGSQLARECFEVMDFPYGYIHESPFPVSGSVDGALIDKSFQTVFRKAASFLA